MASLIDTIKEKLEYIKRVRYSIAKDISRSPMTQHKALFMVGAALVVAAVIFFSLKFKESGSSDDKPAMGFDAAIENYGSEIKMLSKQFDIDQNYLLALIMLESSGRADVPPRFEKAVYQKLKDIQGRKQVALEGITLSDIKDASDEALRNLASSWGPFQLMGYKCLHLGIKIKDLRGPNSLYWGVYWIDNTYGEFVRKGRYDDAFHIHNTGHTVPRNRKYFTYDSLYVPHGIEYMEYFKQNFK